MLTAAPRRGKESFPGSVELAPVRLIGGFVCVDSHLGCAGCHFCLTRRYPAQREVLDRRVHRDWAEAGLPPDALGTLVAKLPAIAQGGVPVRFGHLSDLRFEVDGAKALLAALPASHPVMLLTRFPPVAEVARLIAEHKNAMLNVSITPSVPGAIEADVPPRGVFDAMAAVPPELLFVMLGPLVEGSEEPVRRLLPEVPRGAALGFKPLAAEGVPFPVGVAPLSDAAVKALAEEARALGLDVPPMAGCRLRTNLGIPFFRHREFVPQASRACEGCRNQPVCAAVSEPSDGLLREQAAVLGLTVDRIDRTGRGISAEVTEPVARADETFLSEKLRWPVYLSGIRRGGEFRVVEVDEQVLQRWERTGFYPVTELVAVAARMAAMCGLGAGT
jgi:hypothetical protein